MQRIQALLSSPLRLVMFDLDGTLVDSVPDLHAAVDATLSKLDRTSVQVDQVRNWVGNGAAVLLKRALAGDITYEEKPEDSEFDAAMQYFFDYYDKHNGESARLYEGALDLISDLRAKNVKVGIVTNKPEKFTFSLLDKLNIPYDFVVGGDTLENRKPAPDMLIYCSKQLDTPLAESVMIGDSVSDVNAARNAGVPIICVSYGYNHGLDIRDEDPDLVIDSLSELR